MTKSRPEIHAPRVSRDLSHDSWIRVLDFIDLVEMKTGYLEPGRDSHVDISLLSAREIGEAVRISGIEINNPSEFQNNIIKDAFRLPFYDSYLKTNATKISLIEMYKNKYAVLDFEHKCSIIADERRLMLDSLRRATGYSSDLNRSKIILGKIKSDISESAFNADIAKLVTDKNVNIDGLEFLPITVEKNIRTLLFEPKKSK